MPWNQTKSQQAELNKKAKLKHKRQLQITIGIIAVVILSTLCLFLQTTKNARELSADTDTPTKHIQKKKIKKSATKPTRVKKEAVSVPKKEMYLGQEVITHTYKTNSTGRSVREIIVTADGKKHGRTTVIAKPVFKYGTDQMLADVLFPLKHGSMAPWPEMDAKAIEKEFARSILDPIVISEDDSEEVRMKKEAVKHARSEMIQLIKEGHSVLDILQQQRDTNEHAKDLRLTVTKELYKMRKEGASADEIREYLNRANQILEQSGIESVSEPVKRGRK